MVGDEEHLGSVRLVARMVLDVLDCLGLRVRELEAVAGLEVAGVPGNAVAKDDPGDHDHGDDREPDSDVAE